MRKSSQIQSLLPRESNCTQGYDANLEEGFTTYLSDTRYKHTHVTISVQDQDNQIWRPDETKDWIKNIPLLAKSVKLHALIPSWSTMLLMSIPIATWNLLPDDPACMFIESTTSSNTLLPSYINADSIDSAQKSHHEADREQVLITAPVSDLEYDPMAPETIEVLASRYTESPNKRKADPTSNVEVFEFFPEEPTASNPKLGWDHEPTLQAMAGYKESDYQVRAGPFWIVGRVSWS